MKRDFIDFFVVRDDHIGIHARLEAWAQWVKVRPHGWQVSPMFRQYKADSWHGREKRREPRIAVNIPQAVEMERAVSGLPEKHRTAIRFAYVCNASPRLTARDLGVSLHGLADLIHQGRTMLQNRGA